MEKRKIAYLLLSVVCTILIVYALANNYVLDPGREHFLSSKTGLQRELNVSVWLKVMYIHVAFACLAMASGLLNFSKHTLDSHRKLHRVNGYIYLFSVLIVLLTSGYMAPYATGNQISSIGFNVLNLTWLFTTITAFVHIKRKRITLHRAWMVRSYAFCFNNMLIHLFTAILHDGFGLGYTSSYTIGIYGSIATIVTVPTLINRRQRFQK
ncbi:DUF2306 domain-containing protein [Cohnella faecalis]|uniref:DUF2306 domain-containing protein n=1 Tax=Cohnella faecalis TaxID=2315694 RepID=A0A398D171_9BACL|nr:DUF2306 domain-containing protein [Cohnella faecalis]RIE05241.1 DUF2306 domain-containing protein [Cohnella faecalis]